MSNHQIFDNDATLFKEAADLIKKASDKAIKDKGKFTIALSGGNTPRKLYELLAEEPFASLIDWKNIFVFWSDERFVPMTDKQNNSNMAISVMLNKVAIPVENIFPVPVNLEPEKAAEAYETILTDFFDSALPEFDLILLGLGDNGHTASLFPFTSILKEKVHLVKEVFVEELNAYRISFTAKLINHASHVLFLVTGREKSFILKTINAGSPNPAKYPVQLITTRNISWYLDKDAASQLNNS